MKVTITNLKAPWPAGTGLGSVVEFEGDQAPAWALGKFGPADADAEAVLYEPPARPAEPGPVLQSIGTVNLEVAELKDALDLARAAVQSLEAENAELRGHIAAAGERIAQFEAAAAAASAQGSDIDAQAAAEKASIEAAQGKNKAKAK